MAIMKNEQIIEKITTQFGDSVREFNETSDILTFEVDKTKAVELIQFLRDDETLRFNFLTTLCGVHYPDNAVERQFCVVYHMHNWLDNVRIRFKAYLSADNLEIDTATKLYECANWMEREAYDFFGIIFNGHPDLKRILNMEEMTSFPMRKDFPLEDQERTDKDDRYFGRIPQNTNLN